MEVNKVEEVFEAIQHMDNAERWRLLDKLFFEYFNSQGLPRTKGDITDY